MKLKASLSLIFGLSAAVAASEGELVIATVNNGHMIEMQKLTPHFEKANPGVKVKWVNFGIMLNMGFLAGVAGVLYSARTNSAQPAAGNMFELDAISAAFIGGAAVTGGVGKVTGALVGGLIMAVMSNGMQLLGIELPVQQVVKGLVLLLAVAFDVYNKRRAGAR